MALIINTNINSLTAQRNLNKSQSNYQTALQRLSSGLRINSAADDAAGLAIANRFQAQVNGTQVAIKNAGEGVNLAQTAGSALSSITDNLQRIRELAVEASNGSKTNTDRQSLQQEVDQLKQEIHNTASSTNFNGKNLLDGSFQNQIFQIGANVGQTVSVSINKVDTSNLGTAQSAGVTGQLTQTDAAGITTASNVQLASGDLVINGVSVGATNATTDTSSTLLQSSSAIAKAAAINAVSGQSGVTATANANTAAGTDVTGISAATSGTVTINNVAINVSAAKATTNGDVQTQLQGVANQINSKSDQTGVTASVVQTKDGYRVDLSAKDGRNIAVQGGSTSLTQDIGLAKATSSTATVFVGTVTLSSSNGTNINLSTTTGNIDNAGFEAGTFSGVNGGAAGDSNTVAAGQRQALNSGDLLINGIDVGSTSGSSDTSSYQNNAASGIALAAAINKVSDKTGVSATVDANNVYSSAINQSNLSANTAYDFKLNNVDISFSAGSDQATTLSNLEAAVNAKSGQTGVSATSLGSDKFTLTAADGRNVTIAAGSSNNYLTTTGASLSAGTTAAGVSLQSAGEFTLGTQTGNIASAGFNVGTFGGAQTGTTINNIDITTQSGAQSAITAVDNALQTINTNQANLGAIQNRFTSTVSTLQSLNVNLQSSLSSIQGADFAAETAALSKAQVLQQAGISLLAQANANPRQALSLLQ